MPGSDAGCDFVDEIIELTEIYVSDREFLLPLERQSDLAFWRVELECAQSNCESRTKWHTLVPGTLGQDEVLAVVYGGEPPISCANHHPLVVAETKILQVKRVFEV